MSNDLHVAGTMKTYLGGFLACIVLTLASYFCVDKSLFSTNTLIVIIVALALVQTVVQMVLFLHLGQEDHPHWNLNTFIFAVIVILVVVLGSLWIMYHLNYRMMPPMDMEEVQKIHSEGL
ncbi:MAG: cytochrome o ubiquinol oxidase subunit IV [Rhabdochlamydiaceae bacterium]|nr:cytochrome o ubiquinol oxidase subunit IV [Rhabdochlamydiaceae bacterium]